MLRMLALSLHMYNLPRAPRWNQRTLIRIRLKCVGHSRISLLKCLNSEASFKLPRKCSKSSKTSTIICKITIATLLLYSVPPLRKSSLPTYRISTRTRPDDLSISPHFRLRQENNQTFRATRSASIRNWQRSSSCNARWVKAFSRVIRRGR